MKAVISAASLGLATLVVGVLGLSNLAEGATVAYWRMEGDGVTTPTDGTFVRDTNGRTTVTLDGILVEDSSGNGNNLYTWDNNGTGHQYRPDAAAGAVAQTSATNSFSIQNNGGAPASMSWSTQSSPSVDVELITPAQWTIEASVKATTVDGTHRTFVGRDGNGINANANLAPLYFKMNPGNLFEISFVDMAGNVHTAIDSTGAVTANQWYNLAAVSDGTTLRLYKDSLNGNGYQLVASTDISGSANSALTRDFAGSTTPGDPQWSWSIGRGRYGTSDAQADNHVDRFYGFVDEVRISDAALYSPQFLFSAPAAAVPTGLLSYESFSGYSAAELPVQNPSVTGYTGGWSDVDFGDAEPQVLSGSLIYSDPLYAGSSGDRVGVPSSTSPSEIEASNSGRAYRLLDSSLAATDATEGTVYLSWLFQSGQETGATVYQMLALNNGNGDANRNFDAGINDAVGGGLSYTFGADNVYQSLGVATDTDVHLFVAKFELSATPGGDMVTVWIDPTLGGGEPGGGLSIVGLDLTWDRLNLSDYDGNSASWDEIRWSTTFDGATLVPEPSSLALAGLGLVGLGLACWRRRRK